MSGTLLRVASDVLDAQLGGQVVVALESTLIAHGLPWPANFETALAAEQAVRNEGAMPATVAVWKGRPTIGLSNEQIESLAQEEEVLKASTRDLGPAIAMKRTAATTVAATMRLAHRAGILFFATGGIGGVHRGAAESWDVSADVVELSRAPVAVVCAGAKNILDLPRTLEMLETFGVPVIGFRTDQLPAFFLRESGLPVPTRAEEPEEVAAMINVHWRLGGFGAVVAQPVAEDVAMDEEEWDQALHEAEQEAERRGIRGKDVTPALLLSVARLTQGKTVLANQSLVIANARLAAQIALQHQEQGGASSRLSL